VQEYEHRDSDVTMAPPHFPRPPSPAPRGAKRVPVAEKHRKIRDTPIKKPRRRPTNKKKIEILSFLNTPREFELDDGRVEVRKPTTRETGAFYGVHSSQVTRWRQQEEQILGASGSSRAVKYRRDGKCQKMEQALYDEFTENHQKGIPKEQLGIGDYTLQAEGLMREELAASAECDDDLSVDGEIISEHENWEVVEFVEQGTSPVEDSRAAAREEASAGIHCPGCQRLFKNARGVGQHRKHCAARK
jgi:hypothetical protein